MLKDFFKNEKYVLNNTNCAGWLTIIIFSYLTLWNNCLLFSYLGDIYIPYLSVTAIKQGLALHSGFHSQFGWIYHYLYYFTDRFISAWPQLLTPSILIPLTSSFLSVGALAVFLLINKYSPSKKKLSTLLLLVVILLCLSQRVVEEPSFDYITQAGAYNNNTTAFFFLQVFLCYLWQDFLLQNKIGNAPQKPLYALYALQAFFLYFFLNYKITLFISAAALTGSLLFLLPPRERWRYVVWVTTLFLAAVAFTALAGYDYVGYFHDLWVSLVGRKVNNIGPHTLLPVPALLLFITIELSRRPVYNKADAFTALKDYRNVFFGFCLSISTLVVTLGISARPNVYTVMAGAMMFLLHAASLPPIPDKKIIYGIRIYFWKSLSLLIVGYFVLLSVLSSWSIFYENAFPSQSFHRAQIGNIFFSVPKFNQKVELDRFFNTKKPDVATLKKKIDHYIKKEKALPPFALEYFAHQNEDLVKTIQPLETAESLKNKTLLYVGYINTMPVIFGSKIPSGSYHWIHTNITVGLDDMDAIIIDGTDKSDLVVTPFYGAYEAPLFFKNPITLKMFMSILQKMQTSMNCIFYKHNKASGYPLKPFKITKYNTFWAKDDFLKKHKLNNLLSSPVLKNEIEKSCGNAGYFSDLVNDKLPKESLDNQ